MSCDLNDLADRVEAASGADRELDRTIKEFVGHAWDYAAEWPRDGQPIAFPYTASIDAAITLVPEGYKWKIMCSDFDGYLCEIWTDGTPEYEHVSRAATPALALTAAALRARAQEKNDDL